MWNINVEKQGKVCNFIGEWLGKTEAELFYSFFTHWVQFDTESLCTFSTNNSVSLNRIHVNVIQNIFTVNGLYDSNEQSIKYDYFITSVSTTVILK